MAKGAAARLAGREVPKFADDETSFGELKARIAKTVKFIESVAAKDFDGSEDRDIALTVGGQEMRFKGAPYLTRFVLPNLYFHATAAYAILRRCGLDIGKRDFLGGV
jgi:hypothetical protein